jgi:hypothetical protein
MHYRDNARSVGRPIVLRFYRFGAVARWFMTVLVVACGAFFLSMASLTAKDSSIRCERATREPVCVLHERYPFGLVFRTQLPSLADARVDHRVSRSRSGSHDNAVLVLYPLEGETIEFPGVGKHGSRAYQVATELSEFLNGGEPGVRAWRLRESAYAATLFMVASALGVLVLVLVAFRRTRVVYDPRDRRVALRVGRTPARARAWSSPLDEIAGVEMATSRDQNGPVYSARFVMDVAGERRGPDLGLVFRGEAAASAVVRSLETALAQWREGGGVSP